ncbi:MAG: hypothetical protein QGG84_11635, partial [Rhodospirillales bacterium]|nr:hypothetical protein [Rhodospirillales bacterium]
LRHEHQFLGHGNGAVYQNSIAAKLDCDGRIRGCADPGIDNYRHIGLFNNQTNNHRDLHRLVRSDRRTQHKILIAGFIYQAKCTQGIRGSEATSNIQQIVRCLWIKKIGQPWL